jgi:ubiquinone biosynthesis protein
MVDHIPASKKAALRRAFSGIVDRDALGLVRSLVDMGLIPLTNDIQPFVQFVDRILEKYRDISPSEFKSMDIEELGKDIMEAFRLSTSIQIPNDFILFSRVVGMLNGLGSQLDPENNIIEIATPFAKRFILSDEMSVSGMLRQAGTTGRSLTKLPKLLADFLVTTGRGETRMEITSREIERELKALSRMIKGLILAFLTAGTGMAAVLLRINHFDVESAWLAAFCGILLLWIVKLVRKR